MGNVAGFEGKVSARDNIAKKILVSSISMSLQCQHNTSGVL